MRVDYLEEFMAVVALRSFTEAAKALHLSQSALSKHISALEVELDVDLLQRCGDSIEVTKAGRVFLDYAAVIVGEYKSCLSAMKTFSQQCDTKICIGYLSDAARFLLNPLLSWFSNNVPETKLGFVTGGVEYLENKLSGHQVDIAITIDYGQPLHARCGAMPIYRDELMLVVHKRHPLAAKPSLTVADLRGQRVILPLRTLVNQPLSDLVETALGQEIEHLDIVRLEDVATLLDTVSINRAVAFTGAHNLWLHREELVFRRVDDVASKLSFPVSMLWLHDLERTRTGRYKVAIMKQALAQVMQTAEFAQAIGELVPAQP